MLIQYGDGVAVVSLLLLLLLLRVLFCDVPFNEVVELGSLMKDLQI
jgi:hypothetical protein